MRDVSQPEIPGVAEFRMLMGRFATGVCVVAIEGDGGAVSGITVNSLVSVSLDPMLVSWSLQNGSSQFDMYARAARFTVSILGETQSDLARRYASRADSRLRREDFAISANGLPVIAGALGHLECVTWSTYEAGDHTLIFGEVIGIGDEDAAEERSPLCFYDGRFTRIAP